MDTKSDYVHVVELSLKDSGIDLAETRDSTEKDVQRNQEIEMKIQRIIELAQTTDDFSEELTSGM